MRIRTLSAVLGVLLLAIFGTLASAQYDGTMHDLGTLEGMTNSQANGINNKGQIVGVSSENTVPTTFRAFLYDGASLYERAFHDLGTLGGSTSSATAINDKGVVVGESQISSGAQHAFLYDGEMHDLGAFNDGATNAKAINNHGQVVGQWNYTVGHTQQIGAFLYDHGTLYDLMKLLDSSGEGWIYLIEATSINKSGQIVGAGVMQDGVHAFRMDPKVRCHEEDEKDRCREDDKTDRCHGCDKTE
jgi:probable HAF family extracellular repeat protein